MAQRGNSLRESHVESANWHGGSTQLPGSSTGGQAQYRNASNAQPSYGFSRRTEANAQKDAPSYGLPAQHRRSAVGSPYFVANTTVRTNHVNGPTTNLLGSIPAGITGSSGTSSLRFSSKSMQPRAPIHIRPGERPRPQLGMSTQDVDPITRTSSSMNRLMERSEGRPDTTAPRAGPSRSTPSASRSASSHPEQLGAVALRKRNGLSLMGSSNAQNRSAQEKKTAPGPARTQTSGKLATTHDPPHDVIPISDDDADESRTNAISHPSGKRVQQLGLAYKRKNDSNDSSDPIDMLTNQGSDQDVIDMSALVDGPQTPPSGQNQSRSRGKEREIAVLVAHSSDDDEDMAIASTSRLAQERQSRPQSGGSSLKHARAGANTPGPTHSRLELNGGLGAMKGISARAQEKRPAADDDDDSDIELQVEQVTAARTSARDTTRSQPQAAQPQSKRARPSAETEFVVEHLLVGDLHLPGPHKIVLGVTIDRFRLDIAHADAQSRRSAGPNGDVQIAISADDFDVVNCAEGAAIVPFFRFSLKSKAAAVRLFRSLSRDKLLLTNGANFIMGTVRSSEEKEFSQQWRKLATHKSVPEDKRSHISEAAVKTLMDAFKLDCRLQPTNGGKRANPRTSISSAVPSRSFHSTRSSDRTLPDIPRKHDRLGAADESQPDIPRRALPFGPATRSSTRRDAIAGDVSDDLEEARQKATLEAASRTRIRQEDDVQVLRWPLKGGPGAVSLFRSDVEKLKEGEFLNDSLIEFGLKHTLDMMRDGGDPQARAVAESMYLYSSFFYKRFTEARDFIKCYDNVRKWTRQVDIFQKEYLVIPINEHLHWYLAIVLRPGLIFTRKDKTEQRQDAAPKQAWVRRSARHNQTVQDSEEDEEMNDHAADATAATDGHSDQSRAVSPQDARRAASSPAEDKQHSPPRSSPKVSHSSEDLWGDADGAHEVDSDLELPAGDGAGDAGMLSAAHPGDDSQAGAADDDDDLREDNDEVDDLIEGVSTERARTKVSATPSEADEAEDNGHDNDDEEEEDDDDDDDERNHGKRQYSMSAILSGTDPHPALKAFLNRDPVVESLAPNATMPKRHSLSSQASPQSRSRVHNAHEPRASTPLVQMPGGEASAPEHDQMEFSDDEEDRGFVIKPSNVDLLAPRAGSEQLAGDDEDGLDASLRRLDVATASAGVHDVRMDVDEDDVEEVGMMIPRSSTTSPNAIRRNLPGTVARSSPRKRHSEGDFDPSSCINNPGRGKLVGGSGRAPVPIKPGEGRRPHSSSPSRPLEGGADPDRPVTLVPPSDQNRPRARPFGSATGKSTSSFAPSATDVAASATGFVRPDGGSTTKRRAHNDNAPTIIFFDSLGAAHRPAGAALTRYLKLEAMDKQPARLRGPDLGLQWEEEGESAAASKRAVMDELVDCNIVHAIVPEQPNSCDCGVYLLHSFRQFFSDPKHFEALIMEQHLNSVPNRARNVKADWKEEEGPSQRLLWRALIKSLHEPWEEQRKKDEEARIEERNRRLAARAEAEAAGGGEAEDDASDGVVGGPPAADRSAAGSTEQRGSSKAVTVSGTTRRRSASGAGSDGEYEDDDGGSSRETANLGSMLGRVTRNMTKSFQSLTGFGADGPGAGGTRGGAGSQLGLGGASSTSKGGGESSTTTTTTTTTQSVLTLPRMTTRRGGASAGAPTPASSKAKAGSTAENAIEFSDDDD